jgi:hypothetical protein
VDVDEFARLQGRRRINPLPWLLCAECARWSDSEVRGWRGVLAGEMDIEDTPEVFFFCRDCAEREFG